MHNIAAINASIPEGEIHPEDKKILEQEIL